LALISRFHHVLALGHWISANFGLNPLCFTIFLKRAHFKLSFEPKIIKFGFVVAEIHFF
jgi:hypothetical protein